MTADFFPNVHVAEGCILRRKEQFEYTTAHQVYDVELFHEQAGTCYVVAVPREGRLIVYGSPVMDDPQKAMEIVIQKIHKEALEQSGEWNSPPFSE